MGQKKYHVHLDKYASHYEPLFRVNLQHNTKGSTSGLDNKLTEVNNNVPGLNIEVKDLNELIDMSKQLLLLKTETDVPLEIKQKADNYFKNGCLWKVNGKNSESIINDYFKVRGELVGVKGEINKQRSAFTYNKNRKKIIEEYLKYYPGERTRIESVPKEDVNLELISKEVLNKLDEKHNVISKVIKRQTYELSIYKNQKIYDDVASKYSNVNPEEFTNQDRLVFDIGQIAKMEVGENINPQIVNNLTNYIQNGSIDENLQDLNAVVEKYNLIMYDLMFVANNLQEQFDYYDFKDDMKGLQETIDKYDRYLKKMEIIERTRAKINSEIETCQKRMEKNDGQGVFERLETETSKLIAISSLDKLSTKDKKILGSYYRDLSSSRFTILTQYYKSFGIIDGDPKADLVKRIQILENVKSKLMKVNGDIKKREYCNRFLDKVKSDIKHCKEFLNAIELKQACTNVGLKRMFTPGNNNNCVLESITRTINRVNGSDKENPPKAYEEAVVWQSILRAEAVELGFREKQGFYLTSDPSILMKYALHLIEFKDLTKNKHTKFIELLRLNLDNYILTIWKYNSLNKKLEVFDEIKGINAEKEGIEPVWINILFNPGHAEPMFPDDNIDLDITQGTFHQQESE